MKDAELADRGRAVLDLIKQSGGVDGAHHKQWVLDQAVRLLADCYEEWVADYENGGEYEWDPGIPP